MQKLVDNARLEMDQSGREIRVLNDNIKDKQGALALSLLEGNEQMAKLRTNAVTEMAGEESSFKSGVETEIKEWREFQDRRKYPILTESFRARGYLLLTGHSLPPSSWRSTFGVRSAK